MPALPYMSGMMQNVGLLNKNNTPPYAKGRRLDRNQNMRIFNTKKTPGLSAGKPAGMSTAVAKSPPAVTSGNPPTFNKKSAFKAGFLNYVAEKGFLPSTFHAHVKRAFLSDLTGMAGDVTSLGMSTAKATGLAALLAPILTGAATGGIRGVYGTPGAESPETLRKLERVGLYQRLAQEIRARSGQGLGGR